MWKNININTSQIEHETERAVLVKMPHSSDYDGYMFWHPRKLIREGRHSAAVSLSYNETFEFTARRYDKNHDILDEVVLSVEDIEEAFGVTDRNINAPAQKDDTATSRPIELEPVKTEPHPELVDD